MRRSFPISLRQPLNAIASTEGIIWLEDGAKLATTSWFLGIVDGLGRRPSSMSHQSLSFAEEKLPDIGFNSANAPDTMDGRTSQPSMPLKRFVGCREQGLMGRWPAAGSARPSRRRLHPTSG